MTKMRTLRRIVLPQAMRVMVPPIGNEVISMVKLTSLASVIQYSEILHNAQVIYYANTRVLELLLVASFWYLVIVSVLSRAASPRIERHYAGAAPAAGQRHDIRGRRHVRANSWSRPSTSAKNFGDFRALDKVSLDRPPG